MSTKALMPKACTCGRLAGTITGDTVICICIGCGIKRANVSPVTQDVLAGIAQHFCEVGDAVIFRRLSAMAEIAKQDAFLKRKHTPSGETWFDIITRCLDENFLGGEAEPEIAHDPIGTGSGQSASTSAEEEPQNE